MHGAGGSRGCSAVTSDRASLDVQVLAGRGGAQGREKSTSKVSERRRLAGQRLSRWPQTQVP